MSLLVTGLTVAALTLGQPPADKPPKPRVGSIVKTPRRPNPLAPSLAETTDAQEDQFDRVINRFIEADVGHLRGPGAKQAVADFQKLPPEATFALIRGLNRAAKIDHSCPAVVIARKLARTIRTTHDSMLLDYARENIGSGVERSQHMAVLKDLRVLASQRKAVIQLEPPPSIGGERP